MKILLTGYKGFIGSHLLTALKSHDVTPLDWGDGIPNIAYYDWVVHIGAISSTTESDIEKLMAQNVDYSIDMYDQCRKYRVGFQFASSASLYGHKQEFKESSPVDPRTPYAWSKYMVERYVIQNPSYAPSQVFRYFNVYGTNEEHKGGQASPFQQFRKQVSECGAAKVFERSDEYKRDFVHVSSIVDTHIKFFNVKESGIWNIGTGKTQSFLDIAKLYTDNIEYVKMPPHLEHSYQKYTCADMTKTNDTLRRYNVV